MTNNLYDGEDHTNKYLLHRPRYPKELFECIINYYFDSKQTNEKIPLALDVGCGSGQATVDLSSFCERVIGIDVSADQIAHAIPKDNVEYRCNAGEDFSFLPSNSTDLITVATALHWLDVKPFVEEAKRILKPQTGVLAIWLYTFGNLENPAAEAIYYDFHHVLLFPYRNAKQHVIEDYYQSLVPLFPYQSTLLHRIIEFKIETTLESFIGLIETGSACQTYRKQNGEQVYQDALNTLRNKLVQCYTKGETNEKVDSDSIKITLSRPIHLYLMKKNEI